MANEIELKRLIDLICMIDSPFIETLKSELNHLKDNYCIKIEHIEFICNRFKSFEDNAVVQYRHASCPHWKIY